MSEPSLLAPLPEPAPEPRQLIRTIRLAHCKRGPDRCEECRRLDGERICLLETASPGAGKAQRRLIYVDRPGGGEWHAFEVVCIFDSEPEAAAYAVRHGIDMRID